MYNDSIYYQNYNRNHSINNNNIYYGNCTWYYDSIIMEIILGKKSMIVGIVKIQTNIIIVYVKFDNNWFR